MPPRSNEFQRLIRLIEERVAPAGATVEESVMIPDTHDGTPREVDILVRIPVGERELRIGIEARDRKRKADVEWIEQMKARYDLLPIDRRVAVSRRGFSKAALAKARLYHIETLSLQAAERTDWLGSTNMAYLRLTHVLKPEVTVYFTGVAEPWVLEDCGKFPMSMPADSSVKTLADFIMKRLEALGMEPKILKKLQESPEAVGVDLRIPIPPDFVSVTDLDGKAHEVCMITATILRGITATRATVTDSGRYNSTGFTISKGAYLDRQFQVTITERPGEPAMARLEITKGGTLVVNEDIGVTDLTSKEHDTTGIAPEAQRTVAEAQTQMNLDDEKAEEIHKES